MNRHVCCSDLHGMLPLWRQIQEYCDDNDTIYVLGDGADKGPDSWDTLKEVLRDPRVKYIKGNHDVMLLEAWRSNWRDTQVWFQNGGYVTYEQLLQDPQHEVYLCELNRQPYKRRYERADGTRIHLTHAGFTPVAEEFYPDNHNLVWDRDHWYDSCEWWDTENPDDWIVCGHTPIRSSIIIQADTLSGGAFEFNETFIIARRGHKILIDGGCFRFGDIALLDLDTFDEHIFETF